MSVLVVWCWIKPDKVNYSLEIINHNNVQTWVLKPIKTFLSEWSIKKVINASLLDICERKKDRCRVKKNAVMKRIPRGIAHTLSEHKVTDQDLFWYEKSTSGQKTFSSLSKTHKTLDRDHLSLCHSNTLYVFDFKK